MSVGVLGGTFDPVHLGHLVIAEEARLKLSLDKVLFVPAGRPWFKDGAYITPSPARLDMLRLSLESNPGFSIDTREVGRPGPSYTVDTMAELRQHLGLREEIYFIVGLDALAELPRWKDPERLVDLCCFAGMKRPGYTRLGIPGLERTLSGISRRIQLVDNVQVDISSSDIRRRVQEGLSIRYLVPRPVEEYIKERGLYAGKC